MSISSTIRPYKINNKIKTLDAYTWQGLNRKGKHIRGELNASSIIELKALLRQQGITPKKVSKKGKPLFGFGSDKKIQPVDIAILTRQISTMLGAGVPLVQSIEMIGSGYKNANMKKLLSDINIKLQSGIPLSQCLRDHSIHFDDLYCDLVHSGEQSGTLDVIYDRIATYKEKTEALKSKIKKALIYPVTVLIIAFIVTSILLIFVVPVFKDIFNNFGAQLPAFTLLTISISEFMQSYWHFGLLSLLITAQLIKTLHWKSKNFRDDVDRYLLKTPIAGKILKKAAIARYSRTLSTTFSAGVPLPDALESAAAAASNAIFRDAILEIRTEVVAGMQMNIAMRHCTLFPDMVIQMVAIGEESGAVDDMLSKIALIYEQEVDNAVDNITTLIEPMIMVLLGVVIGGLIIAMYLPIFQMGQVI